MRNGLTIFGVAAALAWLIWHGERFISANSACFDEGVTLTAGRVYWETGDFDYFYELPPLFKLLWSAPSALAGNTPLPDNIHALNQWNGSYEWLRVSPVQPAELFASARRMTLACSALLVLLAAWWCCRAAGRTSAVLVAWLLATEPTFAAHSGLLSSDLTLSLTAALTAYAFWELRRSPARWNFYLFAVALGLSLASKHTALALVPIFGLMSLFGPKFAIPGAERPSWFSAWVRIGVVASVVLAMCYGVVHVDSWVMGLKYQLARHDDEAPEFFFLGGVSAKPSIWYYPVCLLVKCSVGWWAAVALAFRRDPARMAAYALLPALLFAVAITASGVNLGVRLVLPSVVLAAIGACSLAGRGRRAWLLVAFVVWSASEHHQSSPHELSYANPAARAVVRPWDLIGDSNFDWGQDLLALRDWWEANGRPSMRLHYFGTATPSRWGCEVPTISGYGNLDPGPPAPADFRPRYRAVSLHFLQGLHTDRREEYARWLRERSPVTKLGGGIWVYEEQ